MTKIELDKFIYRFRTASNYSIQELMTDDLTLSSADTFNDPYDISVGFNLNQAYESLKNDELFISNLAVATAEMRSKTVDERIKYLKSTKGLHVVKAFINYLFSEFIHVIKTKLLIGCFTPNYFSEPMWAHYANDGSGFAVGYDQTEIENSIKKSKAYRVGDLFNDVIYNNLTHDLTPNLITAIKKKMNDGISLQTLSPDTVIDDSFFKIDDGKAYDSILYKKKEWEYEKEKRLVIHDIQLKGNAHVCVASITPKLVILGEKINLPLKYLVTSICYKKGIALYTVEESHQIDSRYLSVRPVLEIEILNLLNNFKDFLQLDGLIK